MRFVGINLVLVLGLDLIGLNQIVFNSWAQMQSDTMRLCGFLQELVGKQCKVMKSWMTTSMCEYVTGVPMWSLKEKESCDTFKP